MFRLFSTNQPVLEVSPFRTITRWLETILPSDHNNNSLDYSDAQGLPHLSDLLDELGQLEDVLAEMEIKTVMGHCNITPEHIFYNAFDKTVKFTGRS